MKKLLLLILFTIIINFSAHAVDYDSKTIKELNELGVFLGDSRETKIIGKEGLYIILYNPSELSFKLMNQEANLYCSQSLGNNYTTLYLQRLGKYTSYFSCGIENKYDPYYLSDEEIKCIKEKLIYESNECIPLNKKNVEIIDKIELQQENESKYKRSDFIYSIRNKFYNEIKELEQTAEDKRINKEKEIESEIIQKNIQRCKEYNFEEGSDYFNECLLLMISYY